MTTLVFDQIISLIIVLSIAASLSGFIAGLLGVGGGIIMLVALAQSFSPGTLIPLHGAIQLSNNLSRIFVYRKFFRWHLIRSGVAIIICSTLAFVFKDIVFNQIILAPRNIDFPTYIILCKISNASG